MNIFSIVKITMMNTIKRQLNALFKLTFPDLSFRTGFTSKVVRIPERFILITYTDVSGSRIFLTVVWYVVVNCSWRARLTDVSWRIPKRFWNVTVNFYAFVKLKTKSVFLRTRSLLFYTLLKVWIPLFIGGAAFNTTLESYRPGCV